MSIIDDPILALIARFVIGDLDHITISDEEFLQQQISEIKKHIDNASSERRHQIALDWIKEHAERYRQDWHRSEFSKIIKTKRCADCPLVGNDSNTTCSIHAKWVGLLHEYLADKINSEQYIEETLGLLSSHKKELKISQHIDA